MPEKGRLQGDWYVAEATARHFVLQGLGPLSARQVYISPYAMPFNLGLYLGSENPNKFLVDISPKIDLYTGLPYHIRGSFVHNHHIQGYKEPLKVSINPDSSCSYFSQPATKTLAMTSGQPLATHFNYNNDKESFVKSFVENWKYAAISGDSVCGKVIKTDGPDCLIEDLNNVFIVLPTHLTVFYYE